MPEGFIGYLVVERGAEPVYALGSDLSLYPKGDVDLNGEVTPYDACLILTHSCWRICGLPEVLTADQIEIADVDGEGYYDDYFHKQERLTAYDASLVLTYTVLCLAGYDFTLEDVVAGKHREG